jgi:enamine deaminase RidA (YjgF/YER057c/UK114 family)
MSDIVRYGEGALFSQAIVHNGTAYLSGQVSEGNADCSVEQQTREVLAKIDALLDSLGSRRDKILNATIWLRRTEDYAAMNTMWVEWLGDLPKPTRATVCAVELAAPVYDVEIAVIAAV